MKIIKIAQDEPFVDVEITGESIITKDGVIHRTLTHGLSTSCDQALQGFVADGTSEVFHTDEYHQEPAKVSEVPADAAELTEDQQAEAW